MKPILPFVNAWKDLKFIQPLSIPYDNLPPKIKLNRLSPLEDLGNRQTDITLRYCKYGILRKFTLYHKP